MANQTKTVLTGESRKLPMMPIRDMVIFPHMMTPFVVGRASSVRALEEALTGDRKIFLATQHDASLDEPSADDIYQTGTIGNIVQSVRMPDGNIKVLVEGVERARSVEVSDDDGFFVATVRTGKTNLEVTPQVEQLMQRVHTLFEQYVKLQQSLNQETKQYVFSNLLRHGFSVLLLWRGWNSMPAYGSCPGLVKYLLITMVILLRSGCLRAASLFCDSRT